MRITGHYTRTALQPKVRIQNYTLTEEVALKNGKPLYYHLLSHMFRTESVQLLVNSTKQLTLLRN